MNRKYKNFIFDMGNVLLDFSPERIVSAFESDSANKELLIKTIFKSEIWYLSDEGKAEDEDIIRTVNQKLPEHLHEKVRNIVASWHEFFLPIPGAQEFINLVRSQGYNTYILSNINNRFFIFNNYYSVLRDMDGVIASAKEKCVKPDRMIYELICNRYSLKPEESIFIDDREENIQAASEYGMRGIIFNGDYLDITEKLINEKIL